MESPTTRTSKDAIRKEMKKLIPEIDINKITIKQFLKKLSNRIATNLKPHKKFIRDTLTEILDEMDKKEQEEASDADSDEEEQSSSEDEREEKEVEKKKVVQKNESGYNAKKKLSPKLSAFLGRSEESRPQVVKALWAYFKEHGLQNPDDRRELLLDDTLKAIFDVDRFTMFQLNKYIGAHVYPFKPVNLTEMTEGSKKKKEENKKRKLEQKKNKGKKKQGSQPAYRLSDDLIKVVGKSILPRPQVTQKLWTYIKKNELQVRCCYVHVHKILIELQITMKHCFRDQSKPCVL